MVSDDKGKWDRRGSLDGITWRVGFYLLDPFLHMNNETGAIYGFQYELWRLLTEDLNVTSELVEVDSLGKLGRSGKWSGMTGMLQGGDLDISMSAMSTGYARQIKEAQSC